MRRLLVLVGLVLVLLVATQVVGLAATAVEATPPAPAAAAAGGTATDVAGSVVVKASAPRKARAGMLTAIRLTLPRSVAAIDGRVLVERRVATLMGVAVHGKGVALLPVPVHGGFAFGAYGMKAHGRGKLVVDLVLLPKRAGRIGARVVIDALAGRDGRRLRTASRPATTRLAVGKGARSFAVPTGDAAPRPARSALAAVELLPDGRIDRRDLDVGRASWELTRLRGTACGTAPRGDANADGCTDIVDLQATLAAKGHRLAVPGRPAGPGTMTVGSASRQPAEAGPAAAAPAALAHTFTVTSTADTADAARGDGLCADSQGRCTLRAAIAEADSANGDDRIAFDIAGGTPAVIQLGSRLPYITSRQGTLVIDGYSQPGSRVNDAAVGSNAVPGVDIRGNGTSAKEVGLFISSPGNTVRGLALGNLYRGIFLDGVDAHDNRIVGNWIGFRGDGTNWPFAGYGVLINTGAHDNLVGTPALADRNVIGNWTAAVDEYGPGTDRNVVRNNQLCIRPTGGTAICNMGVDHNFGPKNGTVGGDDPYEKNVIGPTYNQGIEISHGWDPSKVDTTTKWQVNGNHVTGNWVGFRMDGSYDASYRSGIHDSSSDNANGINVYDGTNDNVVQRNYVASVYDGIQVMAPNAQRNIVRGNIIGIAPSGQNAPMARWGIKVRWGTRFDVFAGNTIRNAALGGIGLVGVNNAGQPMSLANNIRLTRNIITNTTGPAIFLAPDPNDPTTGSNGLVRPPVILTCTASRVTGTAAAGATVEVYRASRQAGSTGLPVEFLGDTVAASNGTWSLSLSGVANGDRVTALQIRTDDDTSELAVNTPVGGVILPPPPPDPLAQDAFERTLNGAWGDATFGGTWAYGGSQADFSVSGGAGRISTAAGQSREGRLGIGAADVIVTGSVAFDRLPVGNNAFAYVLARQNGTTAYRASIRVSAAGGVYVQLKRAVGGAESNVTSESAVAGLTAAPGARLAFRFRVVGDQLRFRVWAASGAEPDTWNASAQDATSGLTGGGGVGLRTYTGSSVSNGPVVVALDDFGAVVP